MRKKSFLISTITVTFFSFWLIFNDNAMGLRQDADAGLQLGMIRKDLATYSKMKPTDAREYYEDALNELHALIDIFAGTEEALEAKFYIGATLNLLGNNDDAIEYFDDVLNFKEEIDKNFQARLLYFKAKSLLGSGRVEEAKDVIAELRIIEPGAANTFGKELGGTMRIGMSAPDFHTKDFEGNPVYLSQYEGKVVIMNFWATWNDQCLKELPEIKKLYRKLNGPEVQFIGISSDDNIDDLRGFVRQHNIEWPQICEEMRYKGLMSKLYDVNRIPIMFVLDQKGKVQYIGNKKKKIEQIVTTLIVRAEKRS
ncbi:MAG: Thiol-disulfide oxidoreductase ResA [Candidatus Scalindua arabica]|uniref:Thiol-disulfide oxidoreductase ResA n=1 Tax=Candidatus Scalindua arabica TaxID=1127984 RepID=A0A942A4P4_9BACT|nr:Thiol-disulfide oxidoreductase ResA [Candidatus Scalindua arabica]